MALIIDTQLTCAMDERCRRGRSPSVIVSVDHLPRCGDSVSVHWAEDSQPPRWTVTIRLGDVSLWVDRRIARYAQYYPVVLAVARWWWMQRPAVTDPLLMVKIAQWERTHPLGARSA
jgi:hypothetical protein